MFHDSCVPVIMSNRVGDGIDPNVAHVKLAGRVWKHAQDVKVGFPIFRYFYSENLNEKLI